MLIRAPDARRMIEAEIAADRRRAAAAKPAGPLSFEQQLERVRNGARVVAKPITRSSDPAFTLAGVASGMI